MCDWGGGPNEVQSGGYSDSAQPWVRAQWDKRQTCRCGHRYGDHAKLGTKCLAASTDPDQRTGQFCECSSWEPMEPRFVRTLR